jgi:hypothetical protein
MQSRPSHPGQKVSALDPQLGKMVHSKKQYGQQVLGSSDPMNPLKNASANIPIPHQQFESILLHKKLLDQFQIGILSPLFWGGSETELQANNLDLMCQGASWAYYSQAIALRRAAHLHRRPTSLLTRHAVPQQFSKLFPAKEKLQMIPREESKY